VLDSAAEVGQIESLSMETFRERAGEPEQLALCIRSLTTILQYTEQLVVLALLDTLNTLAERHDAVAHYHVNREVHDDQTLHALSTACDTVYEYDGEVWHQRPTAGGEVPLRSR